MTAAGRGAEEQLGLVGATVLGSRGRSTATRVWTWWWRRCRPARDLPRVFRQLFVGGGPQESALKAQVASLGLGDRVIFTGRVAAFRRSYRLTTSSMCWSTAQVDASDRPGNTAQAARRPWRRDRLLVASDVWWPSLS